MLVRLWLFLLTVSLWGHDIAGDVKVHAYLKPEGQAMRVVLRVPLVAMRDIDFPRRGQGFLDVERSEPFLR
ncbi:MAG: hypothetical protein RL328_130, partial [Acidobacteriota bacterium]